MRKIAEIEENFKAFDTLSVDFLFLALTVRGGRLLSEERGRHTRVRCIASMNPCPCSYYDRPVKARSSFGAETVAQGSILL